MNLDQYKVTCKEHALRLDSNGKLLILKPTAAHHQTTEFLSKCALPDINFNKHFFRPKTLHLTKVLHETEELEIIDYKTVFAEELKKGTIEQYVGDGVIITELTYTVLEAQDVFLKRVLGELKQSLKFYSRDKHYATRFYLEDFKDSEQHKIDFTQIVLDNLKQVIQYTQDEL